VRQRRFALGFDLREFGLAALGVDELA